MDTITTNALGKMYSQEGKHLVRTRLRLQALEMLGKAERGKRTYPILGTLPAAAKDVVVLYDVKFHSHTVAEAVEAALDDIEGLRDEMVEWRDNLDGTGLEATCKYEEVDSAAGSLEYVDIDSLREAPKAVAGLEFISAPPYDVRLLQGRARMLGRWRQMSNALTLLGDAVATTMASVAAEDGDVGEWLSSVDEAIQEWESVDFPSMY